MSISTQNLNDDQESAYKLLDQLNLSAIHQSTLSETPLHKLPKITLTYAQTFDGFIALPGQQLAISSPQSMVLTHALRATHDAILVGVQTIICDNPSLSTRFVDYGPPPDRITPPSQPRPVILDSHLRCPLNAKVLSRNPFIFTTTTPSTHSNSWDALIQAGAQPITINSDSTHRVDIVSALEYLHSHNIHSVMIEGGSQVIKECLSNPMLPIHSLIVTVSPMFLGHGVHAVAGTLANTEKWSLFDSKLKLVNVTYALFGRDSVLCASIQK
ncbi:hypothetical protein BDV3_001659 [Batrachochytrium dendrobatidis]|uniref:2,5-diamino-6-ribosylamino-4(3H)-pyrimidinone 5'-phosphate reductase n=2 Tax=Batrachochytrium dendrobatidis TaxID=109871 RepID=A0A177WT38_BATDL|nr:RibD domain-containing protein [Batrachochytrium dendrobatidis JEL423]